MASYKSLNNNALTLHHHHPYGMMMPDRDWSSESGYRFGFNGQEQDFEVDEKGNSSDFSYRFYNSRIAKFLSVDPLAKEFSWNGPYNYAENSPIAFVDLEGLERYYAADGTFLFKFGNSPQIMVYDAGQAFKFTQISQKRISTGMITLFGSYPLQFADDQVFSNIATSIFIAEVKVFKVSLYKGKVSVNENIVVPGYVTNKKGTAIAEADFYPSYGAVLNLKNKDMLSNYYNLISTMIHEQNHILQAMKDGADSHTTANHYNIYIKQFSDPSWQNTSLNFKMQMRTNAVRLLTDMSMLAFAAEQEYGESGKEYYSKLLNDAVRSYEETFNVTLVRDDFFGPKVTQFKDPEIQEYKQSSKSE